MTIKVDMYNRTPNTIYDFNLKLPNGQTIRQGEVVSHESTRDRLYIAIAIHQELDTYVNYSVRLLSWVKKTDTWEETGSLGANAVVKVSNAKATAYKKRYESYINAPDKRTYVCSSTGNPTTVVCVSEHFRNSRAERDYMAEHYQESVGKNARNIQVYRKPSVDTIYGMTIKEYTPILLREEVFSYTCEETGSYIRWSELGHVDEQGNTYSMYSHIGSIMYAVNELDNNTILTINTEENKWKEVTILSEDNLHLCLSNGQRVSISDITSMFNHSLGEELKIKGKE